MSSIRRRKRKEAIVELPKFIVILIAVCISVAWLDMFITGVMEKELLSQDIPSNLECVHQATLPFAEGIYMCRGDYHGTN